jgi:HSP20 family protein
MLMEYAPTGTWPDLFLRGGRQAQRDFGALFEGLRLGPRTEFPPVNVWAGRDGAIVTAEIPGVAPEQIDITVHQDTVTLRGRREREIKDEDVAVHRQERAFGDFARTVVLPFRVDADKVSARFERGVLILTLPRPEADKPRQIKIARA